MRFRSATLLCLRLPAALLLTCLVAGPVIGQQGYPTPLLKKVFPPGAQSGSTVELILDGTDLDGDTGLYFSTPGFKVERIPDPAPDPKKKNQPLPPPRYKVTLPANVPVGHHDIRLIGKWGISNPRAFVVGHLPEVEEKEPNNDVPQAQKLDLGTTVNGVIQSNTDVDYVCFAGKKGDQVVIHCAATTIDSRLSAYLQLFTAEGRELASNRFYRDGDALVARSLPADGDYCIRLSAFAYQGGGAESFYRLTLTRGPWIDAVYPPLVPAGKPTPITVYGHNLPGGKVVPGRTLLEQASLTVTAPAPDPNALAEFPGRLLPRAAGLDGFFPYQIENSNPALIAYASGPIVLDNEANDTPETAQELTIPCDLCGRVEKRNDRDYFSFSAVKDEVIIIEGFADRLRSPVDLYFLLTRAEDGRIVGEFDTNPELPGQAKQFYTYTDDPLGRVVIPADGKYILRVGSRDWRIRGGPREVYWVSLRRERPDFDLVAVGNHEAGTGLALRRGSSSDVQVVCLRQDGFAGEITLSAEGLPAGVTCEPQILGPKVTQGVLVLSADGGAKDWTGAITLKGTATIGGKPVVRAAVGGCLVYPAQGNNPALSRLTRSLCLAVRDAGPFRLTTAVKELAIPVGGSETIKVKVEKQIAAYKDNVVVNLAAGPVQANGTPINIGNVNIAPDKEGQLKLNIPSNAPPGRYSLVFRGTGKMTVTEAGTNKKRNTQPVSVSRPIALTLFDTACEVQLPKEPIAIQAGSQVPVRLMVKRLHGFKGPITVELVPPRGGTGLSASSVTIAANANEAKLTLKAEKNAKPTRAVELTVRATAKLGNLALKTEEKFSVAVAKGPEAGKK